MFWPLESFTQILPLTGQSPMTYTVSGFMLWHTDHKSFLDSLSDAIYKIELY